MASYTRQTAVPCTLAELKDGTFIQQADLPGGIQTQRGLLGRVSVFGVMVEKQPQSFLLDDGTGTLAVRVFDDRSINPGVGNLVLVVGKPREYDGEKYLVLEICRQLKNSAWVEYRKRELELLSARSAPSPSPVSAPSATKSVEVEETAENPFEAIIGKIRELDDGQGADMQEVLSAVERDDKERLLQTLIEEGEVFQIRPGRVKVLE